MAHHPPTGNLRRFDRRGSVTVLTSQFVSSVPMLARQWIVEGYIWQCRSNFQNTPDEAQFVAVLPDARVLLATAAPVPPVCTDHIFTAWPVEIYSDADHHIPLAVLDSLGRYAQIESFSIPLEDDNLNHAASDSIPAYCRFLCGQTTGDLHICPD